MTKKQNKLPVCFESLSEKSQRSWEIPKFYEDRILNCVDCGKEILFTAEQQKEWYEVKKRFFFQNPIRCPEHHEKWRRSRRSKFSMEHALERLKKNPESRKAMREYAMALVEFHKETGKGDLRTALHIFRVLDVDDEAVSYCRKALKG